MSWWEALWGIADPTIAIGTVIASGIAGYISIKVRRKQSEQDTVLHDNVKKLDVVLVDTNAAVKELRELLRVRDRDVAALQEEDLVADDLDGALPVEAPDVSEPLPEGQEISGEVPANLPDLIEMLKSAGADLDWSQLKWSRKVNSSGDARGNRGWFVTDESSGPRSRWFVHRGRHEIARVAIPLSALQAWMQNTSLPLTDIRFDYRSGGSGRHAWFVETYDGRTWRVSQRQRAVDGWRVEELQDTSDS